MCARLDQVTVFAVFAALVRVFRAEERPGESESRGSLSDAERARKDKTVREAILPHGLPEVCGGPLLPENFVQLHLASPIHERTSVEIAEARAEIGSRASKILIRAESSSANW